MRRAVFLDRDGVINKTVMRDGKPLPPSCFEELEIIDGVKEALDIFKKDGLALICVTNQPDVARGTQKRETVELIHKQLLETLPLDAIYVCYEDGEAPHRRKPKPGMLLEAAEEFGIDLSGSFMVGDRWKDIEAGRRAGCKTILIDYGYGEENTVKPDKIVKSLFDSIDYIINYKRSLQ